MCRVSACGYTMGVRSSGAAGPKEGAILHCVRFWKYGETQRITYAEPKQELGIRSATMRTIIHHLLSFRRRCSDMGAAQTDRQTERPPGRFVPIHNRVIRRQKRKTYVSRANLISCWPQHDSTYANNLRRIFKIEHSVVYPPSFGPAPPLALTPIVHPHALTLHIER
ncbi:hypothetical protein EVAR_100442_1 [Eumeta japonica]|uniref:Uncharacterized protein n=1 Tax=Eumeta variegata TaxID=151549 RepID=A0A4C1ZX95_EUMVA|nr:hypothetical protein EVAR_100442_1 [Eumeta japonica]